MHELEPLWSAEPPVSVIVLTSPADVAQAVKAMRQGAFDCVELLSSGEEGFMATLDAAMRYNAANRLRLQRRAELHARVTSLTPREREVMALLAEGVLNKVIASRLGLSRRTVEAHRSNVMSKMRATSVAHLINMALLIETPALPPATRATLWRRYDSVPLKKPWLSL